MEGGGEGRVTGTALQDSDVRIQRGSVFVYRMFDVAEVIDLSVLEANGREERGTSRLRIARSGSQAIIIKNAPVSISLRPQQIAVHGVIHECDVQARVWDYGVVSLQFRIAIPPGSTWAELVDAAALLDRSDEFERVARERLTELLTIMAPALREPHQWHGTEDYIIYFLEEVSGLENDAAPLLERADVAALLLGEATQPLAERTRRAIAESAYQYWARDLAVIDWNSALVVEPSGVRDIPDVIEFALTHLMELRYYDDLLDERLAALYAAISKSGGSLSRGNYARLSREAGALFMDISEFLERVENSLKVIGDHYLATIFRASVRRLRLQEWEDNVTRKLELLARVSELLSAQATAHHGHILEWIVIILIAFEIVWALVGLAH